MAIISENTTDASAVTSLTAGSRYVWRVGMRQADGNLSYSGWSEPFTATAPVGGVQAGSDLDIGTGKILYSNVYPTLADLPDAASYHGMFAHVHAEGAAYYAHDGNWVRLADESDIPTAFVSGLNGLTGPVILAGGSNVQIGQSGNQLTISSTQTFTTLNGESGTLSLVGGGGISVATVDGTITVSGAGLATEGFVNQAVADLVNSAPQTLDTLAELANALNNDSDFAANVTSLISQKTDTSVNTLTGNVTLIAGDNINISSSGQNLTISSTASDTTFSDEQLRRIARNLRITRNSLGELNLEWDSPLGYVGEYTVELTEVGLEANVTSTSDASVSGDGSLEASISVAGGVEIGSAVLFAANGSLEVSNQTAFFPATGDLAIDGSNATITNAYLPGEFLSPGAVHLMVVAYDTIGFPVGRSDIVTRDVEQHGSPVAPEIAGIAGGDGTIDISLFSKQTPHQRGFYDFAQITYFAEINTNENATTGWVRGSGVVAEESDAADDFTTASVPAIGGTQYFARVVAANPLGEGEARTP